MATIDDKFLDNWEDCGANIDEDENKLNELLNQLLVLYKAEKLNIDNDGNILDRLDRQSKLGRCIDALEWRLERLAPRQYPQKFDVKKIFKN